MNEITTTLPRSPGSARLARDIVTACTEGLSPERREDALLLTSELVANALQHGKGVVTLRVANESGQLLVEVADQGHGAIEMTSSPAPLVAGACRSWTGSPSTGECGPAAPASGSACRSTREAAPSALY